MYRGTWPVTDSLARLRRALADRYVIDREIGRGGAAVVYLAEDRKHRRSVAIKVLQPQVATEIGAERFVREIETVARLTHPHILPLFDSGEADGLPYFVMPYVSGETLRERLAREHQLPLEDALEIARDVAGALGYAHSMGIVHRDIKPGNILLSGGHAVVTDFGVARAISAAREGEGGGGGGPVEVFGTPAYMSPEQASGSARLDGRSDLYSLGCVLYEMLAGHPPFDGETAAEVRLRHLTASAPSLLEVGREIPPEVEEAVRIALAKVPADRFLTAQQFVDRLALVARNSPARTTVPMPRQTPRWTRFLRRRRVRTVAGIALVVTIVGAAGALVARDAALDPGRFVVLSTDGALGGQDSRYVALLREELERWSDVRVAREMEVLDVVRRQGAPRDVDGVLDAARTLGAGRAIRLVQRLDRDSLVFGGAAYDTRRGGRLLASATVRCAVSEEGCAAELGRLARTLLVGEDAARALAERAPATRSVEALRRYGEGMAAFGRWRLDEAASAFAAATATDPGFADAHLGLAEVRWWLGRERPEWLEPARAATALEAGLGEKQRIFARGLVALGEGRQPDACAEFDRLIARDSLDFAAWFGRGDCHAQDRLVVRDRRSPSGWAFRSSFEAAITSYRRALLAVPGVHGAFGARAYERLGRLFVLSTNYLRLGRMGEADSVAFAAWPALDGDTLAFVPWPYRDISTGDRGPGPGALRAARRGRSMFSDLTETWVRAFPESPGAHLARARALELMESTGRQSSEALREAELAAQLAPPGEVRSDAQATRVRLLLKAGDFGGAAGLADSLLAAPVPEDSASRRVLASVALLAGRAAEAARLAAGVAESEVVYSAAGEPVRFPPAVAEPAFALLTYAVLGGPADSIRALERRVEERVETYVAPERRLATRRAALERPARFAFYDLGPRPIHDASPQPDGSLAWQRQLAAGRADQVRATFERYKAQRTDFRPNDESMDGNYLDGRLYLAVGDTAGAIVSLDRTLGSLPVQNADLVGGDLVGSMLQAGALVNAMMVRAELAAHDGDRTTARQWAAAVTRLWEHADPPYQPRVARMRALAGLNGPR